jgi:ribosome-binding protein aMBF1 (putative translation factor)
LDAGEGGKIREKQVKSQKSKVKRQKWETGDRGGWRGDGVKSRFHRRGRRGRRGKPKALGSKKIAPFVARIRIVKGITQAELARRLGVSKQVISRWEESDYQTVGAGKLQEILDAMGIRVRVTLSA